MRRIYAVLSALATMLALGVAASPAMAASQAPVVHGGYTAVQVNPTTYTNVLQKQLTKKPLAGAWIIRTRTALGNTYLEVTAEGDGHNMELHSTNFSTFNRSFPSGAQGYIYTTPNGLCAHAIQANAVQGSSSNCGASNTGSQWFDDGNGRMENSAYQKFMGADNLANGAFVIDEIGTGAYYTTPQDVG